MPCTISGLAMRDYTHLLHIHIFLVDAHPLPYVHQAEALNVVPGRIFPALEWVFHLFRFNSVPP